MPFALDQLGQIALPVTDVGRAEAFHEKTLDLRRLRRFGDLTLFDRAGVRLSLEKSWTVEGARGCLYYRCADIALVVTELTERGVLCRKRRKAMLCPSDRPTSRGERMDQSTKLDDPLARLAIAAA